MLFWKLIDMKAITRKIKKQNFMLLKRLFASEPWMPIKYLTVSEQKIIENKWKEVLKSSPAENQEEIERSGQKKKYILSMFPYPSGKLHLGHVRVYSLSDAIAQIYRMKGWEVIHPMGWDAFGLPAENAAIERGENPEEWTLKNITHMKNQLIDLGCRFDWCREIMTCSPEYYKWTQFIFLKLYKAGLVYRQEAMVNWDPVDKTVLASEQVDQNGRSWRSGAKVEKKNLLQWFIKTTRLSKDLFEDLSDPSLKNWKGITKIQRSWIGACNGYIIEMKILDASHQEMAKMDHLSVWMAHPEHLEKVAFLAVKSDHLFSEDINKVLTVNNSTLLSAKAVNPISKKLIPIIVNDEVKYEDGGEIYVGIPCLNDQDRKIAEDVRLDIPFVSDPSKRADIVTKLKHLNSGGYESSVNLRDWLISRQRYWGTPIPVVYCADCGTVPVPEEDLPVKLPKIEGFINKGTAVLEETEHWFHCCCPRCGKAAHRETDTMDTFVDSSWYFLRYLDPQNSEELVNKGKAQMFMPVNLYIGGKEHATLHLYYARFINKFLASIGIASHNEPFTRLLVQGMVRGRSFKVQKTGKYLGPDEVDFSVSPPVEKISRLPLLVRFEKMSKSKHNGVDPQCLIDEYGVDAVRLAMLSNAPVHVEKRWDSEDVKKSFEIMEKLWIITRQFVVTRREGGSHLQPISEEKRSKCEVALFEDRNGYLGGAIQSLDLEGDFNLHLLVQFVQRMLKSVASAPKNLIFSDEYEKTLRCCILLLSPICPHLTAELWQRSYEAFRVQEPEQNDCVFKQPWPSVDPSYKRKLKITIEKVGKPHIIRLTLDEYSSLTQEKALQLAYEESCLSSVLKETVISKIDFEYYPYSTVLNIQTKK